MATEPTMVRTTTRRMRMLAIGLSVAAICLTTLSCSGSVSIGVRATPTAVSSAVTPPTHAAEPTATALLVLWPPTLGVTSVDTALAALKARDGTALLALVRNASAACTTASGAGGAPKCPTGAANGTVIDYVPYFECDGWGSLDAARTRLIDGSTYPLAVLNWAPPIASRVGGPPSITHTVVLVRGGLGKPDTASDARLLTTLAFDAAGIREITADCSAYSQAAFAAGNLPAAAGAHVLWRAYPAPVGR